MKRGTLAEFAFNVNRAPMHFNDPFRYGQAQASPSLFAGTSLVGSPESIKDVREIRLRNSDPGI